MIPWLTLIGAGLLGAACASNKKDPETPPVQMPRAPEPPWKHNFDQDPKAQWLYLKLKEAGAKDPELDQGCLVTHYPQEGDPTNPREGAGDRQLLFCELADYVLDRYEDIKFRPLAEALAGIPIPWSLNDFDPSTHLDEKVRMRAAEVLRQVEGLLEKKGVRRGTHAFLEGKALALFALTLFPQGEIHLYPDLKTFQENNPHLQGQMARLTWEAFSRVQEELLDLGLEEYWRDLERKGGLGLELDYSGERSALSAIEVQKGACTEISKILYGLLKFSGLKPHFFLVDPWKSENALMEFIARDYPNYYHINVGLKFGDRLRILDASLLDSKASARGTLTLSLSQYLALDLMNRSEEFTVRKDFNKASEILEQVLRFYPSSPLPHVNLGMIKFLEKNYSEALEKIDIGIKMNPKDASFYGFRASVLEMLQWPEEAIRSYNQATLVNSRNYKIYFSRGILEMRLGREKEAERDFIISLRLSPEKAGEALFKFLAEGDTNNLTPDLQKFSAVFLEETGLDMFPLNGNLTLASVYWKAEQREFALTRLRQAMEALAKRKAPRPAGKPKAHYSAPVLKFLRSLFQNLPPGLREDFEAKPLLQPLVSLLSVEK